MHNIYKYISVMMIGVLLVAVPHFAVAANISNVTNTSFEVNWTYVDNAVAYMVSWKASSDTNYRDSNPISATGAATRYALSNLTPGTQYDVVIRVSMDGFSYDTAEETTARTTGGADPVSSEPAATDPATTATVPTATIVDPTDPPNSGGTNPGTPTNAGGTNPGTPANLGGTNPGTPSNPGGITGGNARGGVFYLQNPLDPRFNSVGGLIQGFLEIFSYLVILLAVLMLMWVGLQFVLSQGDVKKMNELKNWLLWIVVGVAVVIGARIIVTVVINTLQATGTVSPGIIQNASNAVRGI